MIADKLRGRRLDRLGRFGGLDVPLLHPPSLPSETPAADEGGTRTTTIMADICSTTGRKLNLGVPQVF